MDVLYEESAVSVNAKSEQKRYKIISWIALAFGILAALFAVFFIFGLLTFLFSVGSLKSEERWAMLGTLSAYLFVTTLFGAPWLVLFLWKRKMNVSYDYSFVTGELRIAKVFNVNRRKFLYNIDSAGIQKMGDADSPSFERVASDPSIKRVVCTPNAEPAEGKFFLYIVTSEAAGRFVYILECREELLVNLLKFVKRGILESDYVEQKKKLAR